MYLTPDTFFSTCIPRIIYDTSYHNHVIVDKPQWHGRPLNFFVAFPVNPLYHWATIRQIDRQVDTMTQSLIRRITPILSRTLTLLTPSLVNRAQSEKPALRPCEPPTIQLTYHNQSQSVQVIDEHGTTIIMPNRMDRGYHLNCVGCLADPTIGVSAVIAITARYDLVVCPKCGTRYYPKVTGNVLSHTTKEKANG